MTTSVVNKVAGITSGGDNTSAWAEGAQGRASTVFALGTSDITSSADQTFLAAFGWYCLPFMLPEKSGKVITIKPWIGGGGSGADELGWAVYDGITGLLLDSGVKTGLASGAATYLNITGVSATPSDRAVIVAFLAGENGVGNANWDVKALDTPVFHVGLPVDNTVTSQKVWTPWIISGAVDYTSPEADLSVMGTASSGFNDELMLCSVGVS